MAAACLSLTAGLVTAVTTTSAQAASVQLTVLSFNDFHGRIDNNTAKFASTIERLRAEAGGDANTLLVSAGDNIGATLFASANADDEPTIEVLNALDLDSSAVGNHEFDKGYPWFKGTVVDGNDADYTPAAFPYLGTNVRLKDTGAPALVESSRHTRAGLEVCVVGAVTQETPSLVSPDGVSMLEFRQIVDAVNAEVAEMEAATPCDVTVAAYHEGAPKSGTLEENHAASAVFRAMVDTTSPEVDVILNGHTHQKYAYAAVPVPGGGTRPVIQSGSYGSDIGKVVLTVDDATGAVSAATAENVARDSALFSSPRVAEVEAIVAAATADANAVGQQPVGRITADITRAGTGGTFGEAGYTGGAYGDNRSAESSLGDLVAQALWATPIDGQPKPDLAIVNPGGLRADLLYAANAGSGPNDGPGVVTFAEANAVLPFLNNINYVTLSGASLKKIFEQQWQRDEAGDVPSRQFLHLGTSENVKVTLDVSRPEGDRVVRIAIDGQRVTDDGSYVVSTFSFLAQGGDNFHAFKEGTLSDTGKVDRELWIDGFFGNGVAKTPDFARNEVYRYGKVRRITAHAPVDAPVSQEAMRDWLPEGAPAAPLQLGMFSQGADQDVVTVTLRKRNGVAVEQSTHPVTWDMLTIPLSVTSRTPAGSIMTLRSTQTGVWSRYVVRRNTPDMRVRIRPDDIRAKSTRVRIKVKMTAVDGLTVRGKIKVRAHGETYRARLVDGKAVVKLPVYKKKGVKTYKVVFVRTASMKRVVTKGTFKVKRAL